MLKRFLVKVLVRLLLDQKPTRRMSKDQMISVLAGLHQSNAMQQYLQDREEHLVHAGMEEFIAGNLTASERYAGQIFENRSLQTRLRACYTHSKRTPEERQRRAQGQTQAAA